METRREVLQDLIYALGGVAALNAFGGIASVVATPLDGVGRFYTSMGNGPGLSIPALLQLQHPGHSGLIDEGETNG